MDEGPKRLKWCKKDKGWKYYIKLSEMTKNVIMFKF
jgi:hypothetical protein